MIPQWRRVLGGRARALERAVLVGAFVVGLWPLMAAPPVQADPEAACMSAFSMAGHAGYLCMRHEDTGVALLDDESRMTHPGSGNLGAIVCKMYCIGGAPEPLLSPPDGRVLRLLPRWRLVKETEPPSHGGVPPRRPPRTTV